MSSMGLNSGQYNLKMSVPFREYYATSLNPPFAQPEADRKNRLLINFIIWINAHSKYLSTDFDFVRFE